MPSSIFSSDRAPAVGAGRALLVAALVAVAMLAAVELGLRLKGGESSYPLSKQRYAANLEAGLSSRAPETTLLLGASRMRSSFSSDVFAKRNEGAPLEYLATSGESPLALIFHLAEKTDFAGRLIVALSASSLAAGKERDQQYIVEYLDGEWNWNQRLNFRLGDTLSSVTVFRDEQFSFANTLRSLALHGSLPDAPNWRRHSAKGESFYDFKRLRDPRVIAPPALRTEIATAADDAAWDRNLDRLQKAVARLKARGGHVALVRFPTSGNWRANERVRWPRARYWDRIARDSGAVTLHFDDEEILGKFDLPDQSHIDQRDRPAFTSALLDALVARGFPVK